MCQHSNPARRCRTTGARGDEEQVLPGNPARRARRRVHALHAFPGLDQRSRDEYESTLYRFALHFADLDLPDFLPPVGIERMEEFIEAHWGQAARGTRAKNISILKSFFRWAYERERITGDPMLTIKRPRRRQPDRRRQAHEPKAIDAIVRAQHHQRDRTALLLHGPPSACARTSSACS